MKEYVQKIMFYSAVLTQVKLKRKNRGIETR